jgi:hypothetical protein
MPTIQELKNKIKFNQEENQKSQIETPQVDIRAEKDNLFELEEARYMLNLIANSDFKGRDIQVVYNIALKLQNILQTIND